MAVAVTGLAFVSGGTADAQQVVGTYEITITNTTDGQYLTPPNVAVHSRRVEVFDRGEYASPGLEAVAESGDVPALAAELNAKIDARGLGASGVAVLNGGPQGPIAPGGSSTITITSEKNFLSVVSMIICTNDGFGGIDGIRLPNRVGETDIIRLRDFDAGTERNTELWSDIVPAPFCGGDLGNGADQPELAENDTIHRHRTIFGNRDVTSDFDWTRGGVGTITVKRIG